MTRTARSKALLAFEVNMADAEWLVALAAALENQRVYRMRKELRSAIGSILRVPERQQGELDCIENGEIFIVFKPGSHYSRDSLRDRSALLRQAVVAGCAATETFFGDKVIEIVRPMLHSHRTRDHGSLPARLRAMQLDLGCFLAIDHDYERKRRGLTERVVVPYVSERVSVHPDALGHVLALTGISDPYRKIDRHLGRPPGFTNDSLRRIAERRNRIAHTGDRQGRGRAAITDIEVWTMLEELSDTVRAAERVLRPDP